MSTIFYPEIKKKGFPHVLEFAGKTDPAEFTAWYNLHRNEAEAALLESGALLVQGLELDSTESFGAVAGAMEEEFTDYIDISYQRRRLSSNVYISTEYDASFPIKMHNELSYANYWPSRLLFACLIPSATGGETPLADSRAVLRALDPAIVEEYRRKQVRYVRNLHNGQGLGPSWQETFKTNDKALVEQYCQKEAMLWHWKPDGGLKLEAIRPPVRKHPKTGAEVWFSVAELYHPSHFEPEYYEGLLELVNGDEEELPLYASFGDGTKISNETVAAVISTIEQQRKLRTWQQGDLLLVDNMLTSHGRMPYTGQRKIVVYLCK